MTHQPKSEDQVNAELVLSRAERAERIAGYHGATDREMGMRAEAVSAARIAAGLEPELNEKGRA